MDPYKVLGVSRGATDDEIKKALKQLNMPIKINKAKKAVIK